jgi:hypothetical protein
MALSKTGICDFGWKARDFKLKGVPSIRVTSTVCDRSTSRTWPGGTVFALNVARAAIQRDVLAAR